VAMQQEQATLMNTLLGNQNQGIVNQYLPKEKRIGLVNSTLDATGKIQDQTWKPYMNDSLLKNRDASTANIQAGTPGVKADSTEKELDLKIKSEVIRIASDESIPVERRAAMVSGLVTDSQTLLSNLKAMSTKEGLLGVKPKALKETMDLIQRETDAIKNPPKPVSKPALPQPAKAPPAPSKPKPYKKVGQQASVAPPPTLFQAVTGGLQSMFTPNPQAVNKLYTNVYGNKPAPKPQRPVTLPGIRNAKQTAQANAAAANQNVQMGTQLVQQGNQAVNEAETFLNLISEKQRRREEALRKQFTF
jgi:hypothetical protein